MERKNPKPRLPPVLPQGSVEERLASLEASNKALAEVVNGNGVILRDCLEITEARQWMIMNAMDDMSRDGAPVRDKTDAVDWEHYKTKYLAFQEDLVKKAAEEAKAPEESGEDPDAVVFGGSGG